MVRISESIVVRIGRDVHSLNTMDFIKREIATENFYDDDYIDLPFFYVNNYDCF